MSYNNKHLLWWIMRAIDVCRAEGTTRHTLLSETLWKNLAAPEWVLPSIREKYEEYDNGR